MFVFLFKQHPKNFTFLIVKILEIFMSQVCKFD